MYIQIQIVYAINKTNLNMFIVMIKMPSSPIVYDVTN